MLSVSSDKFTMVAMKLVEALGLRGFLGLAKKTLMIIDG